MSLLVHFYEELECYQSMLDYEEWQSLIHVPHKTNDKMD